VSVTRVWITGLLMVGNSFGVCLTVSSSASLGRDEATSRMDTMTHHCCAVTFGDWFKSNSAARGWDQEW
jgi:hypothetical protein